MTEKFTYMDFMMYVLPGAMLIGAMLVGWWFAGLPLPTLQGEGGLLQSVVFVIGCFLSGHFVQAVAHSVPERALKRMFWGGFYASEIMFFAGQQFAPRRLRETFLNHALAAGLLQQVDVAPFTGRLTTGWFRRRLEGISDAEFAVGVEAAQHAFNGARVQLEERGLGPRAKSAEAYYQFYRGSMTASAMSCLLFSGLLVWKQQTGQNGAAEPKAVLVASLLVTVILTASFCWRARGAGQAFAREVCSAYDYAVRHPAATGTAAGTTTPGS